MSEYIATVKANSGREYRLQSLSDKDIIFSIYNGIHKFYEYQVLEEIKRMDLAGIYLDIGANIGNHGVFFAGECFSEKVICIEPCRDFRRFISLNFFDNKLEDKLQLHACALLDRLTALSLSETNLDNIGVKHITNFDSGDVFGTTLDALLPDLDNVVVMKIDTEGCECKVIAGGQEFFKRNSPVLISEANTVEELKEFAECVVPLGYKPHGGNWMESDIPTSGWAPTYMWVRG